MDVTSLVQIGPYRVERFIDAGAFAWVFEVRDPKFAGRRLALKMLMPEAAEGEELRRFESEARLLAQIDHPNVVTIFDFGRDDATGNFYYVMTYVDGPTLRSRLKQGPLPVDESIPLFIGLLDGLARIHENGIVHRDIKPANVLLGADGRARLADLGIARVQAERSQTRTGVAVGTALYMSPEQARGREVDARSDLFSIGLTLYECLTGNVIYDHVESIDSSSGMDVLLYIGSLVHTRQEFDVRFDAEPRIPASIQKVILKSLRLDPANRYASAREMRDALRSAVGADVADTAQWPAVARAPSRSLLGVGAGLAVALIVAGAYFFWMLPRQQSAARAEQVAAQIGELGALGEQALAVASALRDRGRPEDAALLDQLDEHVDRGDRYLEDGRADAASGLFDVAASQLDRGRRAYLDGCRTAVEGILAARVGGEAEALAERVRALEARGAAEVASEPWQALGAVLPRSQPAPQLAGCDAAEHELARGAAIAEAMPLADAVEDELERAWPRVLDAAYEEASTARLLAMALPSEAPEYRLALKEGKRLQLLGARHRSAAENQQARDAFVSAEASFEIAARIAPAAQSRDAAIELAQRLENENATELDAEIREQLAEGARAFREERWEEARTTFDGAQSSLAALRRATEWRRAAVGARDGAAAARSEAADAGAQRSAPTEFAQAEASMTRGERGLESEDAREAERSFAAAREEFAAAKLRSIQALRDADMRRAAVVAAGEDLLGGAGCDGLDAEGGRIECQKAEAELAAGDAAQGDLDAPAALRHYSLAQESYARALSSRVLWEATRPRPPVLVRRVPQRPVIEASPRQLYSFGVDANDPNGDVLRYRWTIDDELQPDEQGPTMKRRLERGATIAVIVDDGRGGELVEQWRVEIVDRSAEAGSSAR